MFRTSILLAAVLLADCQPAVGPNAREERRLGTVHFYQQPVRVTAPDTVAVGAELTVVAVTYGGGCVSQGESEVEVTGLQARVTLYDYETRPADGACTDELHTFEHQPTLRFLQPGRATLRVHGRREPGGEQTTVERTIVVRPAR